MRKISLWGRHHKWCARMIITLSFFILGAIAFYFGEHLRNAGYLIPGAVFIFITGIYFLMILVYPMRPGTKSRRALPGFYRLRKGSDLLLACCTFAMFLYVGNNPSSLTNLPKTVYAAIPYPSIGDPRPFKTLPDFYKSLKDENGKMLKWKERRKLLREQLKGIKKYDEMSQGAKVLLTILCVLIALGLLALVAALACDLSCNGSGAAAALVGVGGTALIVFLFVLAIRGIHRTRTKPKKPISGPDTSS